MKSRIVGDSPERQRRNQQEKEEREKLKQEIADALYNAETKRRQLLEKLKKGGWL